MRYLLGILLSLSLFSSAALAEFSGEILSYTQLMTLTKEKRMKYLSELREVVVMMEKQQAKDEFAGFSAQPDLHERIASIMQLIAMVPEAEAQPRPQLQVIPVWLKDDKTYYCGAYDLGKTTYTFDSQLGTCVQMRQPYIGRAASFWPKDCPPDTVAVRQYGPSGSAKCVPQTNWDILSPERQAALQSGKTLGKDEVTQQAVLGSLSEKKVSDSADVKPADAKPGDPAGKAANAQTCQKPDFACQKLSAAQKTAAENKFRRNKDKDSNSCIAGGFFSTYASARSKSKGGCKIVREFPPGSTANKCKAHEAMCNPWLFCVDARATGDPNVKINPTDHCEALGGSAGDNVTERCNIWYQGLVKAKEQVITGTDPNTKKPISATIKPCDPGTELNDPGVREAWTNLKKSMEDNFQKRCVDDKYNGYQALFCTECAAIADRIYSMTKDAINIGCAEKAPGAFSDRSPPEVTR